eukprot:scaffold509709_cov20-Prasinocladus_malaysianus.AAC.1
MATTVVTFGCLRVAVRVRSARPHDRLGVSCPRVHAMSRPVQFGCVQVSNFKQHCQMAWHPWPQNGWRFTLSLSVDLT